MREDYPAILVSIAQRVDPRSEFDPQQEVVREAAEVFYARGVSPRQIRTALSHERLGNEGLTPDVLIAAAKNVASGTDRAAAVYADLWAIKTCTLRSFLPWTNQPDYPFPPYLDGVVNKETGEIDRQEIDKRIRELKPHANV